GTYEPIRAARLVAASPELTAWMPDDLDVTSSCDPAFSDSDIAELRTARRVVGDDLVYINARLPDLERLPTVEALLNAHKDLSKAEQIRERISRGELPALREDRDDTVSRLRDLTAKLTSLSAEEQRVAGAPY